MLHIYEKKIQFLMILIAKPQGGIDNTEVTNMFKSFK